MSIGEFYERIECILDAGPLTIREAGYSFGYKTDGGAMIWITVCVELYDDEEYLVRVANIGGTSWITSARGFDATVIKALGEVKRLMEAERLRLRAG